MELIEMLSGFGATAFSYLLPFLIALTVVVFFHELGHFLVARWCNVTVQVFSVGFGREIFGFTDKRGTRWKFSWIPLGGYVKFLGDEDAASTPDRDGLREMSSEEQKGSFHNKSVGKRAAVVAAGPIANFLLAIVIFAVMFTFVGQRQTLPIIDSIQPNSAASVAGFQPGDLVLRIDGEEIDTFAQMQRIVSISADKELKITVRREGKEITLIATPRRHEDKDAFGNVIRRGLLGVRRSASQDDWVLKTHDPVTSVWMGTKETYFVISRTMNYLYDIVTGREKADQLGGPIRIAQISGQVASVSIIGFINLIAILSVSIGLINLFPIPMLDGGHLLFYAFEAVRGEPLSERIQDIGFRIGLGLVLMLMIFATWNDLIHLGSL